MVGVGLRTLVRVVEVGVEVVVELHKLEVGVGLHKLVVVEGVLHKLVVVEEGEEEPHKLEEVVGAVVEVLL